MISADTTDADSFDRDIQLIMSDLSPKAQSAAIADEARVALAEAIEINTEALGEKPDYETTVDGQLGAALDSVSPNGTIVFKFGIANDVVSWIEAQLIAHSPVRTGRYRRSHRIFADGVEVVAGLILSGIRQVVLAPTTSYAPLIEPHDGKPGESRQAPDGVYQAIAALARRQFDGFDIGFGYWTVPGLDSSKPEPAIIINL